MSNKNRKVTLLITVSNLTDEQVRAIMVDCQRLQDKHNTKTGRIDMPLKKIKALNDALPREGVLVSCTEETGFCLKEPVDVLIQVEI